MNNFQKRKSLALGCCLIFCHFQPGVAYKSVAYKKSVYFHIFSEILIADHDIYCAYFSFQS